MAAANTSRSNSREAGHVIARQWEMLRLLSENRTTGLTAGELTQTLRDNGFEVHRRTVERDLVDLELPFSLRKTEEGRPQRWAAQNTIPVHALSVLDALSLHMVCQYLRPLLPPAIRSRLQPLLEAASGKLDALPGNRVQSWKDKVAALHQGITTVAPPVAAEVLENVQTALLNEERLKATYRKSDGKTERDQVLSPLGLVMRGNVTYLVAANHRRKELQARAYPLHRMSSAERMYDRVEVPNGFRLARFIETGGVDFGGGELVELRAWVSPMLARQLQDTKLSDDQVITFGSERCEVRATVKNTWRLQWWLLSKAGDCVVREPESLRQGVSQLLKKASLQYEARQQQPFFSKTI
jgi:predicted DNA-binding transcriptional regulator YafY